MTTRFTPNKWQFWSFNILQPTEGDCVCVQMCVICEYYWYINTAWYETVLSASKPAIMLRNAIKRSNAKSASNLVTRARVARTMRMCCVTVQLTRWLTLVTMQPRPHSQMTRQAGWLTVKVNSQTQQDPVMLRQAHRRNATMTSIHAQKLIASRTSRISFAQISQRFQHPDTQTTSAIVPASKRSNEARIQTPFHPTIAGQTKNSKPYKKVLHQRKSQEESRKEEGKYTKMKLMLHYYVKLQKNKYKK